ncbi:amino acid permease [Corynespora cassiicola Philippines]|uniref:Amino acid permease n=1 Tax=Corynespora cassiicola Philippines TaxID=1448308 RepID=A0A2T2PAY4_CORCC|nr:amino acid permease [Corynespora cassiicola Philippines]
MSLRSAIKYAPLSGAEPRFSGATANADIGWEHVDSDEQSSGARSRAASTVSSADELQLEALGHKGELQRQFSPLSMLGLAFAILNSWTALSASLSLALPSGGSASVVWGLITAGICNGCLAASLAEFLSAYPTAGGQYHWVAVIAWDEWKPLLSWITGWINTSGWIALVASGGLLGSQVIIGVISLYHPTYVAERWHQFLIYITYTVVAFVINAFMNNLLPYINKTAITWSITGFVVISITALACASPDYASASFVFTDFINETGWPDGIAWLLGLLQGGLSLTGYDAVAHMIEEIPNASVEGPKIMVYCVGIGTFTGFIFMIVLLFVSGGDTESIISSSAGPLLQILYNATRSRAGAVCLLIFPLVCLLFATTSIMTTSSRMVYAFARDGGLPASNFFARVHPKLGQPLNALALTTILTIVFGCIFLGSSSAFNAIISASVVALGVSYAIPVAINVLRGRKMLPPRAFTLPTPFAWFANLLGIAYAIVTTVLFLFPPELPVTGSNMNYCVVAFAIILIISTVQWFVDGRKNFTGPRTDVGLEVLEAVTSQPGTEPIDPKLADEIGV